MYLCLFRNVSVLSYGFIIISIAICIMSSQKILNNFVLYIFVDQLMKVLFKSIKNQLQIEVFFHTIKDCWKILYIHKISSDTSQMRTTSKSQKIIKTNLWSFMKIWSWWTKININSCMCMYHSSLSSSSSFLSWSSTFHFSYLSSLVVYLRSSLYEIIIFCLYYTLVKFGNCMKFREDIWLHPTGIENKMKIQMSTTARFPF